jgi:hypothetical protein
MTDSSTFPRSDRRALLGALVVGLLFAAICGIGVSSSGGAEVNQPVATASLQTTFDPGSALLGLLIGAPLGVLAGALWGRRGLAGVAGFILVTLAGGLAGLVVAGLVGAQTEVSVTGRTIVVYHGTAAEVLGGGAVLGLVLGALVAWWFGYRTSRLVPAEPSAAADPARM